MFLEVNKQIQIPLAELKFSFARSSGPGGQNVNKVNSKVNLHWRIFESNALHESVKQRFVKKFGKTINTEGDVVISSDESRSQPQNIEMCKEKLAVMIRQVFTPPKKRIATRPTTNQRMQRLDSKKKQSDKKKNRKRDWD